MGAIQTVSIIEPGMLVQLGDYQYSIVFTLGYSDGHICFFNDQYGVTTIWEGLLRTLVYY